VGKNCGGERWGEASMNFSKLTVLLGRASLSVLTFCAVLSLAIAWIVREFPHALDGTDVIEPGKIPNYLRNAFEILSFSSGPALFVAAVFAFIIAVRQAKEAENSRLSTVYMGIVDNWNSADLLEARRKIFKLVDLFRANRYDVYMAPFTNESEYICYCLWQLSGGKNRDELRSHIILLQFLEDLGLLCYKEYIRKEDVFNFIGSPIETQLGFFRDYIQKSRQNADGTVSLSRYANAIYLYKAIQEFKGSIQIHTEEMWH
jgi:hypothetical protein